MISIGAVAAARASSSSEGTVERSSRKEGWKLCAGVIVTLTVGLRGVRISLTDGVGATLLIDEEREGRKMLERNDETDEIDSERARLEGESSELIAERVGAIGILVDLPLELRVDPPSLDPTRTMSYCPASLEATLGCRKELSMDLSSPGRAVDIAEGVYSNRLESIDSCSLAEYETSDTGFDRVLRVELGGGTGGIKNDAGVRNEVVTLLSDLEEADIGVGIGEAVMLEALDAVVVVREETEETVVDFAS